MENRGPGRPKNKLREDWRQNWYDAAESEVYSSTEVWEPYEAAIINCHTADENSRAPILTEKISRNVYSGEKVLTAAVKLNSALSVFLDTYARRVPFG